MNGPPPAAGAGALHARQTGDDAAGLDGAAGTLDHQSLADDVAPSAVKAVARQSPVHVNIVIPVAASQSDSRPVTPAHPLPSPVQSSPE